MPSTASVRTANFAKGCNSQGGAISDTNIGVTLEFGASLVHQTGILV